MEEITPPVHKSAVVVPVDSGKTQDGGAKMHYDRKRRTTVITQANAEQSNPFDVLKKKPGVKRNTLAGKTGGHSFDRLVDMAEDESVATQDVLLAMDIDALSQKECQTLLGLLQLKALARNSRRGSAGSAGSVSAVSEGEEEVRIEEGRGRCTFGISSDSPHPPIASLRILEARLFNGYIAQFYLVSNFLEGAY